MEITEKIEKLNAEQLQQIIEVRRTVPLVEFLHVNSKARSACALRHRGWQEISNSYANSMIRAALNTKMANPYNMATLLSAVESMALGVIAQKDLTLEEYDAIMSPVIFCFPELIIAEQDWEPVPMEEQRYRPRIPYGLPPVDLTNKPEKKNRPYRRTEDLETAVNDVAFDASDIMSALAPKEKKSEITKEEALQKMLDAMKPKPEPLPQMINSQTEEEAQALEDGLLSHPVASPNPDLIKPIRFVKLVTEEGAFRLKDQDNGEYLGEKFTTPIDAIIWAANNAARIK